MSHGTPVFIICSPRPRVGKTLLARVLAEFLRTEERGLAAFDANPDEHPLLGCLPAYTAAASLSDIRGEMALFDELIIPDGVPKLVDLGDAAFDRFFSVMQEIGFMREAQRRSIMPVALFLADPENRTRRGYAMLLDRLPELALVPVFNEMISTYVPFRHHFPRTRKGGSPMAMPMISPVVREVMERPGYCFAAFSESPGAMSTELYRWTRRMFLQFRELELHLLLEQLKPSLQAAR